MSITYLLEHRIEISPGYCLLHEDPKKDFGVGACRVWFYAIGPKGAVQFQIGTDWYPEAARRHLGQFPPSERRQPVGWDIGYHAHIPQYEGQTPRSGKCELLGGQCYYDGSGLQADNWVEGFICGGTAWLWPKLDEYYQFTFEGGEYPDLTPLLADSR